MVWDGEWYIATLTLDYLPNCLLTGILVITTEEFSTYLFEDYKTRYYDVFEPSSHYWNQIKASPTNMEDRLIHSQIGSIGTCYQKVGPH